jgi:hypothetical protein
MTTTLSNLKLVTAKRTTQVAVEVLRRQKLVRRLEEQVQLATAQLTGGSYKATKLRTVADADTGESKTVEVAKRVKAWWWQTDSKKLYIALKYGQRVIELAKGKSAVEVGSKDGLVTTLQQLIEIVGNGDLDTQIAAASGMTKAAFKK